MEVAAIAAAAVLFVVALILIFRTHGAVQAHTSDERDRAAGRNAVESGLFNPADAGAEQQTGQPEQTATPSRPDLLRGD